MKSLKSYKCRSKDPQHCAYHGAAIRIEHAIADLDYRAYEQAREDFEQAAKELRVRGGALSRISGEEAIPNPALTDNPLRFFGRITISQRDEDYNERTFDIIQVHAATRAEVLDKMVHATKRRVDEYRANDMPVEDEEFGIMLELPDLDGRKDTDTTGAGFPSKLDYLTQHVAHQRQLTVNSYHTRIFSLRKAEGKLSPEEEAIYREGQRRYMSVVDTEETWLDPSNDAVNTMWQQESDRERSARQRQADFYAELRRRNNREDRIARERAEAKAARKAAKP